MSKKNIAFVLLVFVVFLGLAPIYNGYGAGVCRQALEACMVDALFKGPLGAYYMAFCIQGYSWCKKYYAK